ncbi:unnamed protein product [Calicophoron daubneyi]|uniref:Heat shock protein 70 n=1 Tax=Calicophoron daubneyi TaxID=300641 RepID=A0AAV2T4U7_CALDB
MPHSIGIDLGTTKSCAAVLRDGAVEMLLNMPSFVTFTPNANLVGDDAKNVLSVDSENTVYDLKRLIGRGSDDPFLQHDMKHWTFTVVKCEKEIKIQTHCEKEARTYSAEYPCSLLLAEVKKRAEQILGESVTDVVITVPASFSTTQREAVRNAGRTAGMNVLQLLDEPTAAAIAYRFEKVGPTEQNLLVFDFGGGILDVSVLTVKEGNFTVRATSGDNHLGGEDFDRNLLHYLIDEIDEQLHLDVRNNQFLLTFLKDQCEQVKERLSFVTKATIKLDCLNGKDVFQHTLTRPEFEHLNDSFFQKALSKVEEALECSKLNKSDIDEVILVGGSSRIPMIQKLLGEYFEGKKPNKLTNPIACTSHGAAIFAASLSGSIPDESVKVTVESVVPISFGWENNKGEMKVLIPRNSTFPVKKTVQTTTIKDNQTHIDYLIYEGEQPVARANRLLKRFKIQNIKPELSGIPTIALTLEVDKDGVLSASAVDRSQEDEIKNAVKMNGESLELQEEVKMAENTHSPRLKSKPTPKKPAIHVDLESQLRTLREQAQTKLSSAGLLGAHCIGIVERCDELINWLHDSNSLSEEDYKQIELELNELRSSM